MIDFTEESNNLAKWAYLPPISLERIYSFLSREDQINMSQVCRNWSRGFKSPSVWKHFRFSLTESQLSMNPCPVLECAKEYSQMFRHVEIVCIRNVDEHLITIWSRRLIEFLDILTKNSQLISLTIWWLEIWFILETLSCVADIRVAIAKFWVSQHHLKRMEYHSNYFIYPVVECLKESPMHFVIRRFVNNRERQDHDTSGIAEGLHALLCQKLQIFQRLPFLEFDYSFILDKMAASQSDEVNKLKILFQYYGSTQSPFRGLIPNSWKFTKRLHPDLRVELYFETDSQSQREIEFFIEPGMPVIELDYNFTVCKSEHDSIMEIDALFNHLLMCKINEHLVSLRLAWILPIPDLASSFISFLQACKKLKRLQLFLSYPVNSMDLLVKYWLENRPESLEKVFIDISGVGNEDNHTTLTHFVTEHSPLLETVGLHFEVKLNIGNTIFGERS